MKELLDTSVPNISMNIFNILIDNKLDSISCFVTVFLETAELRAKERKDITMKFWRENVDKILQLNDKAVLMGNDKVSNQQMEEYVDVVYNDFHLQRKLFEAQQADLQDIEELRELEEKFK